MSVTLDEFRIANPTIKPIAFVYSSEELRISGAVSTSRALLTAFYGINAAANDRYLQLFEHPPQAADVPDFVIYVPGSGQFYWAPGQGGRVYTKLYWAVSETLPTYTASTDTFWVNAEGASL